jgi:hypothetical protein
LLELVLELAADLLKKLGGAGCTALRNLEAWQGLVLCAANGCDAAGSLGACCWLMHRLPARARCKPLVSQLLLCEAATDMLNMATNVGQLPLVNHAMHGLVLFELSQLEQPYDAHIQQAWWALTATMTGFAVLTTGDGQTTSIGAIITLHASAGMALGLVHANKVSIWETGLWVAYCVAYALSCFQPLEADTEVWLTLTRCTAKWLPLWTVTHACLARRKTGWALPSR